MGDGDALSRLIQLHAGQHDIRLAWLGNGIKDLVALCNAHAIQARLAKHLWTGMRELMTMPEMKELPEAIQAQIMSIVLKSQALVDLDHEAHAERMAKIDRTNRTKRDA
jgi:hypothetical protein